MSDIPTLNPSLPRDAYLASAYKLWLEDRCEEAQVIVTKVLRDCSSFADCNGESVPLIGRNQPEVDAHLVQAMLSLTAGDYKAGFEHYQWRHRHHDALKRFGAGRYADRPKWDGKPTDKRLLIWSEQGLGDTLMLLRYLEHVHILNSNTLVEVQPPLLELASVNGLTNWRCVGKGRHDVRFDIHCSLYDLPYILGTTIDTVPQWNVPLAVDPLDEPYAPKLGLCWSSESIWPEQLNRNLDDESAALLTRRFRFRSLQHEHLKPFDVYDVARVIQPLDVVVTVDCMLAHLAGAMGKRVFLMLMKGCDWRWGRRFGSCPWYPNTSIFRQQRAGEWAPVIEEVCEALSAVEG